MNELILSAGFGIIGAIVRVLIISLQMTQLKKKIAYSGFTVYALVVLRSTK